MALSNPMDALNCSMSGSTAEENRPPHSLACVWAVVVPLLSCPPSGWLNEPDGAGDGVVCGLSMVPVMMMVGGRGCVYVRK